MNSDPGSVPANAVRPLTTAQVVQLSLPHIVALRTGSTWRQAWLLGHDRDAESVSFLMQHVESGYGDEPIWLSGVEIGEIDPRFGAATA